MKLSTNRLELVAATLQHVQAEIDSPDDFAALLDTTVESDWPPGEYDRGAQEFFREVLQDAEPDTVGWYLWYAIRKPSDGKSSVLIGASGYFGPPSENGDVEIGFSIVPKWRDQGYATEIVEALVTRAFSDPRVHTVLAHTTPQNLASCKVLTKAGFRQVPSDNENLLTFVLPKKNPTF